MMSSVKILAWSAPAAYLALWGTDAAMRFCLGVAAMYGGALVLARIGSDWYWNRRAVRAARQPCTGCQGMPHSYDTHQYP